jgi:hypothetical protein
MCWRENFHWNLSFIPCTLFKKEKKRKRNGKPNIQVEDRFYKGMI